MLATRTLFYAWQSLDDGRSHDLCIIDMPRFFLSFKTLKMIAFCFHYFQCRPGEVSDVDGNSRWWSRPPCIIGQSMETKSSLEVVEHQITTLGHKQWVCVNLQQHLNVQYRWRHKTKQQLFVSLGGVCSTSLFYHGIGNVLPGRCYLKRKMISLTLCAVQWHETNCSYVRQLLTADLNRFQEIANYLFSLPPSSSKGLSVDRVINKPPACTWNILHFHFQKTHGAK